MRQQAPPGGHPGASPAPQSAMMGVASPAGPAVPEPGGGLADLEELENVLDPPEQILDDAPGDEITNEQDENGNDKHQVTAV